MIKTKTSNELYVMPCGTEVKIPFENLFELKYIFFNWNRTRLDFIFYLIQNEIHLRFTYVRINIIGQFAIKMISIMRKKNVAYFYLSFLRFNISQTKLYYNLYIQ